MGYQRPLNRSCDDIHKLDPFFYYIGSRTIMLVLWVVVIAAGMLASCMLNNWSLLPRFGAIGIMIGTLMTLSPLFINGIYLSTMPESGFDPGIEGKDGKKSYTTPESRYTSNNIVIGVFIITISSAINAFGDYIHV